jgi:outer membrane protein assembly factor BamB
VNATPTVHDGKVFALSFEGDLVAADATSGEEIWRKSFTRDFGGKMMSGWGYSESPLADGDRLIVTPGGDRAMMVALNQATGATIWAAPMPPGGQRGQDGAGYSSVVISNAGGAKQYVQLVGRGVIGVSTDGKLLWGFDGIANGTANCPTPIVSGDLVFCSSGYGDGGSALLQIGRGGARAIYTKRPNEVQNHHGGMILLDGKIYMGHGHNQGLPLCLDMESGRALWGPERGVGGGSAAIAYADGHLYFRYQDGAVALIDATPEEYRLKGEFRERVRAEAWAQPVIAGKKLYLRDQDSLRCYDIAAK